MIGPKFEIDYIPLNTVNSIERRGLDFTIENFLTGTPFTIQSMAYDVGNGKLVGDVGLKALKEKSFGINNLEQAEIFAEKKGMSVSELIEKKAASMGFRVV